jgi:hypothetical protein
MLGVKVVFDTKIFISVFVIPGGRAEGTRKKTAFPCIKYPVSSTGQAKAGLVKPEMTDSEKPMSLCIKELFLKAVNRYYGSRIGNFCSCLSPNLAVHDRLGPFSHKDIGNAFRRSPL